MARGKQTLTQRIALDGGRDIREDLERLGDEGKKAFNELEKATADAEKAFRAAQFDRLAANARVAFGKLEDSGRQLRAAFGDLGTSMQRVGRNAAILSAAVTGAATAFVLISKRAAEAADEHGKTAQAIGLTISEFGRLQFAAEQGGVAQESFVTAMRRFNTVVDEAEQGIGEGAETFRRLGIDVTDAAGRLKPAEVILGEISDRFAAMPDGIQKSALAVDTFGRSGATMIPLLNGGSAAMRELGDQAEQLGRVFSPEQFAAAEAMNDAFNRLRLAVQGTRDQFGLVFSPVWTRVADELTRIVNENRNAIVEFGYEIRAFLLPIIGDLLALMQGREGDVQNTFIITLRDGIILFVKALEFLHATAQVVFGALTQLLQPLLDQINKIFGTKFQADAALFAAILLQFLGVFRLIGPAIRIVTLSASLLMNGLVQLGLRIAAIGTTLYAIVELARAGIAGIAEFFASVAESIASFFARGEEESAASMDRTADNALSMFDRIDAAAADAGETVSEWMIEAAEAISDAFEKALNWVRDMFARLGDRARAILAPILDFLKRIIKRAKEAWRAIRGTEGRAEGGPAFAGGGQVHGPGTSTSDSIRAWLSRGEYVIQAKAVRKYGVGLMNAINGMRAPFEGGVRFALGGLVDGMSIPSVSPSLDRVAIASSAAAGRPLALTIDSQRFDLIAPEDVAGKIINYATNKQVRRMGQMPSWFYG